MKTTLVPRRVSLIVQVADIMRRELRYGKWVGHLPSERSLCSLLRVSRSSLRAALPILEREGLIKIAQGRSTRILRTPKTRSHRGSGRNIVGALLSAPLSAGLKSNLLQFADLQHSLQDAQLTLQPHFGSRFNWPGAAKALEALVRENEASCWLLFSMHRTVQHWFMEHSIPCLVDGFTYADIRLPSIDIDYAVTARHAVGKFLSAGHRRLVFMSGGSGLAGMLASEHAFLEAARNSQHPDTAALIIHHDRTADGIRNALRKLMQSSPHWTGMLVSDPQSAIAVVGSLRRFGMRVPEEVAVISQTHEDFLQMHEPTVASYTYDMTLYTNRLSRLVITLASDGFLPARPTRIITRYLSGGSFISSLSV